MKIDSQGRVVIPRAERERLGLAAGGTLDLVSTAEGLLLERRRRAMVTVEDDGLPLIDVEALETVSNAETIDAVHRQRNGE